MLITSMIYLCPQSNKSPFAIFNEPTSDEILLSLDFDCIAIFCDGSTFLNPGIGGAGLVIQDPYLPQWPELEYSDIYKFPIMDCQKILRSFNEDNAPKTYWIKGHSGIPVNDKVDLVANNARKKASNCNIGFVNVSIIQEKKN
ncbi:ribonuclease HI [Reticulomyxa filosa]|uniref:Ribonuclease HI n=1 Tax=Reticulomyxa filosa TaxID=46433 RepID=X6PFI3_RETFI|nr:ribonuclease HI [Reticulomyxa filosa]|eukprot:ETO36819.1 ribonuclease HI [Reticulomyxa filosa]